MTISKRLIITLLAIIPSIFMTNISFAQGLLDATHRFEAETRWLADNVVKETKDEHNFRLNGFVAYADSKPIEVGDIETFTSFDLARNVKIKIKASLKKIGKHCYVYVETGRTVSSKAISKIVSNFDNKIYPLERAMFGSEWSPGIDGDKRITLLLMDIRDTYNPAKGQKGFTAGYFYAGDEYNSSKNPGSNEREMLYLDIFPGVAGDNNFLSVMAHEFQHMIHWHHDPKEYTWVNESLSQLAPFLCGYGHPNQVHAFIKNSDNNMCAWSNDDMLANYGQVYLWAYYLASNVGNTDASRKSFIKQMVAQTSQGLSGLSAAIKKQKIKNSAPKLFRSFCVANFLNDTSIAGGAYGYDKWLAKLALRPLIKVNDKLSGRGLLKCWSAKAADIPVAKLVGHNIRVSFAGAQQKAGRYSNKYDVAAIFYHSKRLVKPSVEWIKIREYKASHVLKMKLGKRNRMMLVFVNRGPHTMKVEQAFAKNAPPSKFSFNVRRTSEKPRINRSYSTTTIASKPTSSQEKFVNRPVASKAINTNITSRDRTRSILENLASLPDLSESYTEKLLGSEGAEKSAVEVELDFTWKASIEKEDEVVNDVRNSIMHGDITIAEEFIKFYASSDDGVKMKLHSVKNRVRDILKFEALQGNEKVKNLLANNSL